MNVRIENRSHSTAIVRVCLAEPQAAGKCAVALCVRPVAVVTPPENALRLKCFVLVSHKAFEWGIIGAILLNTCFMAVQMYPTHAWVETLDSTTNLIFSSIFALEAVLKLTALFPRQYFAQLPNCFDFFLVCTSIVDISSKARRSHAALTPL